MIGSSTQSDKKHLISILLAFAAVYFIWGTTYLGIRVAIETIPPFFMAGSRVLTAGLIMFIFLRARGAPRPVRLHWRSAVIAGALLLGGGSGLVTWAEQQVPSGTAALIVATVPLWIALFEWLIFRGGRPGKQVTLGLILGLIGIFMLVGPDQILGTADFSLFFLFVLLLSPILWSFGSLYSRGAPLPANPFMGSAMQMMGGGGVLLLAGLLSGEAADLDITAISRTSLATWVYLVSFGSIIAFTAYIWLLKEVHVTKASTYTYVNPVVAVFLGWLILAEPITPATIISSVIIILAVILIQTARQTSQPEDQLAPNLAADPPSPAP
jgi:drug/metabolite transporter (DMT)-like permease